MTRLFIPMTAQHHLGLILFFLLSLLFPNAYGQNFRLDSLTSLTPVLTESSGFITLNGMLITHNDSGGEAAVYEVDTLTGNILRKVVIANGNNVDWEDIAKDDTHIYIGDFGNNFGMRQDLKVYKVSIADYLSRDTVMAESISFAYADQTSFNSNQFQTNFDAEGLIAYGDSLYIFSKNWGNSRTNIYPLSKSPGTYTISKIDSIDAQGLITGATYNQLSQELYLSGYTFSEAFILKIKDWTGSHFSSGEISKFPLEITGSFQVEAISKGPGNTYYISSEGNASIPAVLYRFELEDASGIYTYNSSDVNIFPIPAHDILRIEGDFPFEIHAFSSEGRLCMKGSANEIDVSGWPGGLYTLHIQFLGKEQIDIRKILIRR